MRHNVAGRQFGRTANQRKALLRGLVGSLIQHERIETTVAKAKETRRLVEKLVTLGKRGDVHAKRLAMAKLPNRSLVVKLFDEIAPRFTERNGGYTRIVATRRRVNDRAEMAVIEFVDYEDIRASKTGETAEAKGKKKKAAPKKAEPKKEVAEKAAEPAAEEAKEEKKTTAKKTTAKKTATKKTTAKKTTAKKTAAKKTAASKADSSAKKTTAKKTTAKKTAAKKKDEE